MVFKQIRFQTDFMYFLFQKSKYYKHNNKGSFIQSDDKGHVMSLFKTSFKKKALVELSY